MSKSTKQTTENKPPAWAQPLFEQSAAEAQRLYDSGAGGNTYLGSTVAPLSNTTMQGVNQLTQAGQGWNTAGTRPLFQQLGAESTADPFVGQLNRLAGSINPGSVDTSGIQGGRTNTSGITGGQTDVSGLNARGVSASDYRGILNNAQQPTAADQYLTDTASGKYLTGEGNPFYRDRLEREIADSNALLRSQFSGMGRTGSGVSQQVVADNTRDMLMQGLESDWNRERGLQVNAVGMMDAARQGSLASQLGAASGIAGINTGNADRSLQSGIARAGYSAGDLDRGLQAGVARAGFGAGDLDRNLQAALGRADYQAGNFDRQLQGQGLQGNMLAQAGGLRGAGLDRAMGAANAMAGLDQQNFQNRLTGAGATLQAGNILDQQSQAQLADEVARFYALDNQDWTRLGMLQSAAAGAAGNYGVQNQTMRQPINPWGAIGSIFAGKSDIRLKENIKAVGKANGLTVYEFSYKGQPDRWRGVMAQEIPLGSTAVIMENDGYLAVDYAKLGFAMEAA